MSDHDTRGTIPGSAPASLSPLPPPPKDRAGGYKWALILVGALWLWLLVATAQGWFSIFGDPTGAAGWWFMTSLTIITPACLLVWVMSCGLVALLRRLGGRSWPALLQALPAVVLVVTTLYFLVLWIYRDRTPGS